MSSWILNAALFLGAFFAMEGAAWVIHRYVMHGPMWFWHRSHHEPRTGLFELNDLFAVVFSLPAILGIYLGLREIPALLPIGFGITAYGIAYFLVHDGMVHRRVNVGSVPREGYLGRLHEAHMLHHVVHSRDGAVSFGFLFAPKISHLRELLARRRASQAR